MVNRTIRTRIAVIFTAGAALAAAIAVPAVASGRVLPVQLGKLNRHRRPAADRST